MIKLTDINHVKALQVNLRASLDTSPGKEFVRFLEGICGWYDFNEEDPNRILISHGKRQVLATIKTLMELPAEQIVQLAKAKEQENG